MYHNQSNYDSGGASRGNGPARRPSSFTLIELLVVVAIVALLAALLLPALSQAKKRAQLVVCMSQQKQQFTALVLYADDHERVFPNGCLHSGWNPGHRASGYFSEKDYKKTRIYDGLPNRHTLRGLTALWDMGYLSDEMLLVDPDWENDLDSQCISYKGRLDFSKWEAPHWIDHIPLAAGGWSTGTYVMYTHVGRFPFPGQAGIGGNGRGDLRKLGGQVKWNGRVAVTAVSMCRIGKPTETGLGAHDRERINVTYDDGHVRTQTGIQDHLNYLLSNAPSWRADVGNQSYHIDNDRTTWWRWVTREDGS